jgi:dienelactone hydrolase
MRSPRWAAYPGDEDKARDLFAKQDAAKRTEDLVAACGYLKSRPECNGKFGAVGFCFGGGIVNTIATRVPELAAGVPYYGAQPKPEDVAKIKAAMQAHYASTDERINAGIPAYEAALKAAGVKHEIHIYPNTQHGFHNGHDAALRRGCREARLVAHARLVQAVPRLSCGSATPPTPTSPTSARSTRIT